MWKIRHLILFHFSNRWGALKIGFQLLWQRQLIISICALNSIVTGWKLHHITRRWEQIDEIRKVVDFMSRKRYIKRKLLSEMKLVQNLLNWIKKWWLNNLFFKLHGSKESSTLQLFENIVSKYSQFLKWSKSKNNFCFMLRKGQDLIKVLAYLLKMIKIKK
jgi:hypothetical protein